MWYVCDQSLIYYEPSILGWIRSKPLIYWVPLIKSEPLIISFVIQSHPSIQILLMINSEPFICFDQILTLRSPPFGCPMGLGLPPPYPVRERDLSSPQERHKNQSHLLNSQARARIRSLRENRTWGQSLGEERNRIGEDEDRKLHLHRSNRPYGRLDRGRWRDWSPSLDGDVISPCDDRLHVLKMLFLSLWCLTLKSLSWW